MALSWYQQRRLRGSRCSLYREREQRPLSRSKQRCRVCERCNEAKKQERNEGSIPSNHFIIFSCCFDFIVSAPRVPRLLAENFRVRRCRTSRREILASLREAGARFPAR